jgi:hypothetical protein
MSFVIATLSTSFNGPLNPPVNGSSEMGGLIPGLLSAGAGPAPVITPTV